MLATGSPAGDPDRIDWGPTRKFEARVLECICRHIPAQFSSDHFTLISVLSYILIICCLVAIRFFPLCAVLSIVFLGTQWLGDSMDGTLARYRNRERPRYGLLLDHSIDIFFTPLFVLAYSVAGILSWAVTVPFALIACWAMFYMEQMDRIEGKRRMSIVSFGFTEFRIMLAVFNLSWFFFPALQVWSVSAYDLVFGMFNSLHLTVLLVKFLRDCRRLKQEDEQALESPKVG